MQRTQLDLMYEYEERYSTVRLWDTSVKETFSQRLPDCPYLCDDGLLWKSVSREQVIDIATVPRDDGDDEWLGQEVFVIADACFWCC